MPSLFIPAPVVEAMFQHARAQSPDECCGALLARSDTAGSIRIVRAVRLRNDAPTPRTQYVIAPRNLLDLERDAVQDGLEVIGFYHSHPYGPAIPSETDRRTAVPWYTYVIAGLEGGAGRESLRAYTFGTGAPVELRIERVPEATPP